MTKQEILNLMYEYRFITYQAEADHDCDEDQCVLANKFADEILARFRPTQKGVRFDQCGCPGFCYSHSKMGPIRK